MSFKNRKYVSSTKWVNPAHFPSSPKKRPVAIVLPSARSRLKWTRSSLSSPIVKKPKLPPKDSPATINNSTVRSSRYKFVAAKLLSKYQSLKKIGKYKLVKKGLDDSAPKIYANNFKKRFPTRKVHFKPPVQRKLASNNRFKLVRAQTVTKHRSSTGSVVRYTVSSDGRTLRRQSVSSQTVTLPLPSRSRVRIAGATFTRRGNCYRLDRRAEYTQRRVSTVVSRSLKSTARRLDRRHCVAYIRYGRCKRGAKCKFLHDPTKVVVCARYLRGTCSVKKCPFSHQASPDNMPLCAFFLRGKCTRTDCPYLHVKHNESTAVCRMFLKGHCPNGAKCSKKHQFPRRQWRSSTGGPKVTPKLTKTKPRSKTSGKKCCGLTTTTLMGRVLPKREPVLCEAKPKIETLPDFIPLMKNDWCFSSDSDSGSNSDSE